MAKRPEIKLPSAADIFSTQEERDAERNGAVVEIATSSMDAFPDHPYSVRDDEAMTELVASIEDHGVDTPLLLRPADEGRYTIISGHRRKHAADLIGLDHLPAIIRDMTDDDAIIAMADANLQRPVILPSEKARSYKMKLDAMKRKAGRPSENGAPEEHHLRGIKSIDLLAEQAGESREQIRRYIRIAELSPDLLKLMDSGRMKMRPAVELSYLTPEEQEKVYRVICAEQCTPSHEQAKRIRMMHENDAITDMSLIDLMQESKPNQAEVVRIRKERIERLIPEGASREDIENRVIMGLELLARIEQQKAAKAV
ncbi:ParB/RepB/Spo0J family partition protein [Senegalimassilia anaerobia]|uniref:ParB/RepB/Spo0J family partition protein n=1 Tax=Senegalimassilia anaerobia TaxID=1473216 RepID=UPI0023F48435|nr:ParB/RepB/Spo0J family partition protein [Senegalimassilia anaerobia]